MIRVLFVCSGNICRSPTAEGVFRALVDSHGLSREIGVDSAGIGGWHVGEPPDARSQEAALQRGVDLSRQRARQVNQRDFTRFELLLAMDRGHFRELMELCPDGEDHRIRLFLDFAPDLNGLDVPDPYYGGPKGFETVLDMVDAGAAGLLAHIRTNCR